MILEMAADALGDRVAFGNLDDGLTFDQLRTAARAVADRVDADHAPRHLGRAHGADVGPGTGHPVRGRLGRRHLRPAQLPAPRQPARRAGRAAPAHGGRRAQLGRGEVDDRARDYPPAPELPAVLLFTSGTSAAPKAAILTHDAAAQLRDEHARAVQRG